MLRRTCLAGISVLAPNSRSLYTPLGTPTHKYFLWPSPGLGTESRLCECEPPTAGRGLPIWFCQTLLRPLLALLKCHRLHRPGLFRYRWARGFLDTPMCNLRQNRLSQSPLYIRHRASKDSREDQVTVASCCFPLSTGIQTIATNAETRFHRQYNLRRSRPKLAIPIRGSDLAMP